MAAPTSPIPGLSPGTAGIVFIVAGMFFISVNDMLIKLLSGAYPLHQMVFLRSAIGIVLTLGLVQLEGGWRILRTRRPGLHLLRGVLIVIANMTYFTALAVMPLADATALFFVGPLFITLLSIVILKQKVGVRRLAAIGVGFIGVLVMVQPSGAGGQHTIWVLLLPVGAAFCYALMQVLTRLLGGESKASAMAIYIQGIFLLVSAAFFLLAGDGRYAQGVENESLIFLLRAWSMPDGLDVWLFALLGVMSASVGYCLSQAYRLGDTTNIAAYEYSYLPMAVLWGWGMFGTFPGPATWMGMGLILAAGLYVFWRERAQSKAAQ